MDQCHTIIVIIITKVIDHTSGLFFIVICREFRTIVESVVIIKIK